jgi:hypothetical protein
MGRLDEARAAVERRRRITSEVITTAFWFRGAEQRELRIAGLRLRIGETR